MDKKTLSIVFSAITFAVAFMGPAAHAATLALTPSSGTFPAGRSFTVAVQVSSPDQALNAVQGDISFPTKQLQVLSVSTDGSILNFWVQSPVFSNQVGTVNFAGIAVSPGYQGPSATVLTVTFAAIAGGSAPMSFISGSVLANDGKGTAILNGTEGATFTILPPPAPVKTNSSFPASAKTSVPGTPLPPDPFAIMRVDADPWNPRPVFTWVANDPASGTVWYEARIGNGDWFDPSSIETGSSTYALPPQSPTAGRTLTVRAFDAPGSYRDASIVFDVLPFLPRETGVVCPSPWLWLSCGLWEFSVQWGWLVGLLAIVLLVFLYTLIYNLLRWRKIMQRELQEFKGELGNDLEKIRQENGSDGASLEKTVGHIVQDVGEEIKQFDQNP